MVFLSALEAWWYSLRSVSDAPPLPFTGGWLLYLGYELSAEIEPCLHLPASGDSVTALAIRTPAAWIRDRSTRQGWLVAEPGSETLLDAFEHHVQQITDMPAGSLPAHGLDVQIHEEAPGAISQGRVPCSRLHRSG